MICANDEFVLDALFENVNIYDFSSYLILFEVVANLHYTEIKV